MVFFLTDCTHVNSGMKCQRFSVRNLCIGRFTQQNELMSAQIVMSDTALEVFLGQIKQKRFLVEWIHK